MHLTSSQTPLSRSGQGSCTSDAGLEGPRPRGGRGASHPATVPKCGAVTRLHTPHIGPGQSSRDARDREVGSKAEKNQAELNGASPATRHLTAVASGRQPSPTRQPQASILILHLVEAQWNGGSESKIEAEAPDSNASASTASSLFFPAIFPTSKLKSLLCGSGYKILSLLSNP